MVRRHTVTQLCLLFYHPTLHNKVANISQPWQSFQLYDSGEERNMMDWCQSSGEPYIPDSKHGLPIYQQPPLTHCKDRGMLLFYALLWKNNGFHHNRGRHPIFTRRKLCIQMSWIGPSISWEGSQIEIWHLEPQRLCSLALIWTIACDKLFVSGLSQGEASDNV